MARQRFIHPEIWTDPTVGQLSPLARLLFIGCFSNADDDGRIIADPAYLRSVIFPYDQFSIAKITRLRNEMIESCKNIIFYSIKGREYISITSWKTYQKPKYPMPSKLPKPPETLDLPKNVSGNTSGTFPEDFSKKEETLEERFPLGLGRVGLGLDRDWDGEGVGGETQNPPPSASACVKNPDFFASAENSLTDEGAQQQDAGTPLQAADSGTGERTVMAETRQEEPLVVGKGKKKPQKTNDYSEAFEEFWSIYPRQQGKVDAWKKWKARLIEGYEPRSMIDAAKNYAKYCVAKSVEPNFVKHAATFLGPGKHVDEWLNPPVEQITNVPAGWKGLKEWCDKEGVEFD